MTHLIKYCLIGGCVWTMLSLIGGLAWGAFCRVAGISEESQQ